MADNNFIIVKEHPDLINYIDYLQKKNAESLSFYPKCVFEREQLNGRLFLGLLNGLACGYIYVGAAGCDIKCHQVCIQYDVRNRLYGSMLVVAMEDYANIHNADSITLRCGFDLDANKFWEYHKYKCIDIVDGGIRRNRRINIWRKFLTPQMFSIDFKNPEQGKTNSTIWRKHKQTGIVSQFNRGKKLKDYRASIILKEKPDSDGQILMPGVVE